MYPQEMNSQAMSPQELAQRHCEPCHGDTPPLDADEARELGRATPRWAIRDRDGLAVIEREFEFRDFHQTMAFVNAVAWIAHREDHHPDLEVSYNRCRVRYSTHAVGGLTENDFICAAKLNAL